MFESMALHGPWMTALLVAVVFFVAGLVKGVVGLGLPTVSMALLALVMAPAEAAALLIVPSLVTNVWQMRPWSTLRPLLRRLGGMQIGGVVATWAGAWWLGAPAGIWATAFLGAVLVVYAFWSLAGARVVVAPGAQGWLGPLVGGVTGLVTAATGVFMVPAVPYLQGLGLSREDLVQAMGLSFTVSTIALAVGLGWNAGYSWTTAGWSLPLLVPAFLGMAAGQWLRQRLSPAVFRLCFLWSLAALGAHMLIRQLMML